MTKEQREKDQKKMDLLAKHMVFLFNLPNITDEDINEYKRLLEKWKYLNKKQINNNEKEM